MTQDAEASLLKRGGHSRIAWRHPKASKREKDPWTGKLFIFVYAATLSCIGYLLWTFIHESMHYLACSYYGNGASIASILPNPSIKCDSATYFSPQEVFLYTLSPYFLAVLVLASFHLSRDRFIRLMPYAAFFDLQFNLVLTSLLFMHERKNDALYLFDYLRFSGSMGLSILYILFMAFLVISSAFLFRKYYLKDAGDKRDGRFYLSAVTVYVLIYAVNLYLLLP